MAGVVDELLEGRDLDGADAVRAEMVRVLARDLGSPVTPSYVRPNLVRELRALLADLDGPVSRDGELDVRRLLEDVFSK